MLYFAENKQFEKIAPIKIHSPTSAALILLPSASMICQTLTLEFNYSVPHEVPSLLPSTATTIHSHQVKPEKKMEAELIRSRNFHNKLTDVASGIRIPIPDLQESELRKKMSEQLQ